MYAVADRSNETDQLNEGQSGVRKAVHWAQRQCLQLCVRQKTELRDGESIERLLSELHVMEIEPLEAGEGAHQPAKRQNRRENDVTERPVIGKRSRSRNTASAPRSRARHIALEMSSASTEGRLPPSRDANVARCGMGPRSSFLFPPSMRTCHGPCQCRNSPPETSTLMRSTSSVLPNLISHNMHF